MQTEESVTAYNTRINMILDKFVASMMSYQPLELFKVTAEEAKDVEIKF